MHVLVSCYASNLEKLEEHCQDLWGDLSKITVAIDGEKKSLVGAHGIEQLTPHQDAAMLVVNGKPSRVEHFGFQDGLSNPDIERVRGDGGGTGNPEAALGEFVLGHRAEGGEVAPMPAPKALSQNGSFLVLRKLEQDVLGFRRFLREQAVLLQQVLGSTLPADTNAEEFLAAKMMGRWRDGSPLDLIRPSLQTIQVTNSRTRKIPMGLCVHSARIPDGPIPAHLWLSAASWSCVEG